MPATLRWSSSKGGNYNMNQLPYQPTPVQSVEITATSIAEFKAAVKAAREVLDASK